jgi:AAA domain
LKGIVCSTVDNYQGEENEIVIVSLVRSNARGKLGFIEDKNRINVALSRAKIGLYVLGNFEMIKKKTEEGHLWQRILGLAEQKGYLSEWMVLSCQEHKNDNRVRSAADFASCKNGGCQVMCGKKMDDCGHECEI